MRRLIYEVRCARESVCASRRSLNAGLKITLRDERDDEPVEEVMHYEGGIRQFVEHLNRTKTPLHENVIYMGVAARYLDGRGCHGSTPTATAS